MAYALTLVCSRPTSSSWAGSREARSGLSLGHSAAQEDSGRPTACFGYPTPRDCVTLDELEGQINGLQDELDLLRAEAQRVFIDNAGHG